MKRCEKKQTFVVRISSCQNDTQTQPSSTQSTKVEVQEINGENQKISKYRSKICSQRNWGLIFRTVAILLCAAAIVLALMAVVGWCDQLKVEGTYSKVLLITIMAVLLVVAAIVGLNMLKNRRRFNVALARLDSLILRLEINDDKNMTTAAINRELQLIARILETQTIIK